MIPEKPKRKIGRRKWRVMRLVAVILTAVLLLPQAISGLQNARYMTNMLLLGLILCCLIYLVYQIVEYMIYITRHEVSDRNE